MYHEMIVLVKILRVLREVADLHDKVRKSSPSIVRATVDDLAAKSAERVRAVMGKAKILPHMSIEEKGEYTREDVHECSFCSSIVLWKLEWGVLSTILVKRILRLEACSKMF